MLLSYVGEFMISIININNGSKEPTYEYQKCSTNFNIDIWWISQDDRDLYIQVII